MTGQLRARPDARFRKDERRSTWNTAAGPASTLHGRRRSASSPRRSLRLSRLPLRRRRLGPRSTWNSRKVVEGVVEGVTHLGVRLLGVFGTTNQGTDGARTGDRGGGTEVFDTAGADTAGAAAAATDATKATEMFDTPEAQASEVPRPRSCVAEVCREQPRCLTPRRGRLAWFTRGTGVDERSPASPSRGPALASRARPRSPRSPISPPPSGCPRKPWKTWKHWAGGPPSYFLMCPLSNKHVWYFVASRGRESRRAGACVTSSLSRQALV
jgi:hypothetical protein